MGEFIGNRIISVLIVFSLSFVILFIKIAKNDSKYFETLYREDLEGVNWYETENLIALILFGPGIFTILFSLYSILTNYNNFTIIFGLLLILLFNFLFTAFITFILKNKFVSLKPLWIDIENSWKNRSVKHFVKYLIYNSIAVGWIFFVILTLFFIIYFFILVKHSTITQLAV